MNNLSYTYRIKLILAGVIIWEAIFWSLSGVVLFLIGYLDPSATGQQIGFKFPGQLVVGIFSADNWRVFIQHLQPQSLC